MSLKRIAELTGASAATVSRVLNNPMYRCQDPELTERIRRTARELHYVPNSNARELKMQRRESTAAEGGYVIDVLLARFDTLEKDPFFHEVFRYVETEFYKQNCVTGRFLNVPDISLLQAGQGRVRAQGLLILGKCPAGLVDELHKCYRGMVAIDRNPMEYRMDEVVCSGAKAATTAVEYLVGLGHTRIAYIGDCNMEARYMGYYESLLQHKISLTYDYVVATSQTREEGYRAYERLAALHCPPTAVLCANDVTALGLLQAIKEKNGRKKRQVYRPAVVAIDDIEEAAAVSPMLTTVHIPKEDMAHLAVLTLCDRLRGGHKEYVRLELPGHLMIRESSGIQFG